MSNAYAIRCDRCGAIVDAVGKDHRAYALSLVTRWDLAVGEAVVSDGEGPGTSNPETWTAFVNWQDLCDDCDKECAGYIAALMGPKLRKFPMAEVDDD